MRCWGRIISHPCCCCCKGRRGSRITIASHSGPDSGLSSPRSVRSWSSSSTSTSPDYGFKGHVDDHQNEAVLQRIATTTVHSFDPHRIGQALMFFAACLVVAYMFQRPPDVISHYIDQVQLNMTQTTAEYPSSFSASHEYNEMCDTNSQRFRFNNAQVLTRLHGFLFSKYITAAHLFNILVDLLKTMTAVLMMPVAVIPNADEFRMHEVHRSDLSLRRAPTNHFVTLGSLVPPPDLLWRDSSQFATGLTQEAKNLIDLVHRNLPDSVRAVGAEFDPVQSVKQLMVGPHQPARMVMMPWTVQTALLFFPIQFTQLVWELWAESFLRTPQLALIVRDPTVWHAWVCLSFRYEILLPALMLLLRCYITLDNLRSSFRGDPLHEAWNIRIALGLLLVVVSIPQLLVFLPAMLLTLSLAAAPTLLICIVLSRLLETTLWPSPYCLHFPSLLVAFPAIAGTSFFVDKLLYSFTKETYLCTFAKATLITHEPSGHVTLNAPVIFFVMSMLCCAVAVAMPVWMLRHLAPPNAVAHMLSPEYLYMQWLKSPLYDARALRTDEHDYTMHKDEHFFKNHSHPKTCKYCAHLVEDREERMAQEHVPKQAVLFQGRRQAWEPPCLHWFASEAQRGGICAAELKLSIAVMQRSSHPEDFTGTLLCAHKFAVGLQYAEDILYNLCAPVGGTFYNDDMLEAQRISKLLAFSDGRFSLPVDKMPEPLMVTTKVDGKEVSLLRALRAFLCHRGELEDRSSSKVRRATSPDPDQKSPLDKELAHALQKYLKKESFLRDAPNGVFGEASIRALQAWLQHEGFAFERWLRDEDGVWGTATVIALQRFLKSQEAGPRWRAHAVDGNFERECARILQEFLADRNVMSSGHSPRWGPKGQQGLKHFLRIRGYSDDDCGVRGCYVCTRWAKQQRGMTSRGRSELQSSGNGEMEAMQDPPFQPEAAPDYESSMKWAPPLKAWLRDEGFLVGVDIFSMSSLSTYVEACIEGPWEETTTIAVQQFLNSPRASVQTGASILIVDGDFNQLTQRKLCEYLARTGGSSSCELLVDDAWEIIGKSALQQFLWERGFYCGVVDGEFETMSVQSLRKWLEYEGYVEDPNDDSGIFTKGLTKALQKFLNSAKASTHVVHMPLEEDGSFRPNTKNGLSSFLVRQGEICTAGLDGDLARFGDSWDTQCRRAFQSFLVKQNFLSFEFVTGLPNYEMEKATKAWLLAEGFDPVEAATENELDGGMSLSSRADPERDRLRSGSSPWDRQAYLLQDRFSQGSGYLDDISSDFGRATILALQRYLNSDKAHGVGESVMHEGLCWSLAMFGGVAEKDVPRGALTTIRVTHFGGGSDLLERARKVQKAREDFRASILKTKDAWWGTGELLRCLGDAVWLHTVGSKAAQAAFYGLKGLIQKDEAHEGVLNSAIAVLLGHCRSSGVGTLQVAGEVLAAHAKAEAPEVAGVAIPILMCRLPEPEVSASAALAIKAFGDSSRAQLMKLLGDLTSKTDFQDSCRVMRAAVSIGVAVKHGLLPLEVAEDAAVRLTHGLTLVPDDKDGWRMTVQSLRGMAALGPAVAAQQSIVVELLDDEEGLVVAAVGQVLGALHDAGKLSDQTKARLKQRLEHRLGAKDHDMYMEVGLCQCLGYLGTVTGYLAHHLVSRLGCQDLEVIRAAGEALAGLWAAEAVTASTVEDAANEAAKRLENTAWDNTVRAAACSALGTLGAAGKRHEKLLHRCWENEDEANVVRQQARQALVKLRLQHGQTSSPNAAMTP